MSLHSRRNSIERGSLYWSGWCRVTRFEGASNFILSSALHLNRTRLSLNMWLLHRNMMKNFHKSRKRTCWQYVIITVWKGKKSKYLRPNTSTIRIHIGYSESRRPSWHMCPLSLHLSRQRKLSQIWNPMLSSNFKLSRNTLVIWPRLKTRAVNVLNHQTAYWMKVAEWRPERS